MKVLYTLQPVLSLPEAFKHPKLKTLIGRFQGLLSHESLLALCAYLYGSGIYNDRANDLDIVLPGINNPAGKSLLKTLTDLLQEQGAIISVIGPDGEFGYKKNDPFRHVIPILWDGIKIDLVVCEGTLLEHMSGLDFTMSANCYDLRNHSYLPSDVEYNMRFQMDLVNRVIDTIYEPMDSFMLDPTRILRAFYILSNCCYSSLSVGCYQAIVGFFKDQKNSFLQPNYYMPPARIHLQLDRILFSANKLHTIYWLTRYDVFQALISYLEKTSPTRPENNNYIESLLQAQGESFQAFSPPPSPQFQPVPGYTNTSASNVLFFHQEPAQEQAADSAAPRPQSIK